MPKLEATQANRSIAVTSPLGDDVLLFHSMNVSEQLGRLFQFELDLLSSDPEIKLQDIVGQNITIRYLRPDGENRYFNGYVNQFSQAGSHGNLFVYRATLRPWFWFLTRTADCRIFQNKTVPDIIKEVFRDKGFSDFEDALSGSYRKWENCVQYRETDFNFVSRLMEQEGIYYFFKHEESKHTLVLSDSISAHETVPGYEEVPYYPPEESERRERDHISNWSLNQIIQPGVYALNDYDFKKPRANLEVKSSMPREHDQADFEIYDYPGEYKESSDGETYARARIEELQAQYEEVQGQGNVAGLMTGCLFKLINYVREDQNREYLITTANYNLGPQEYESDFAGGSGSIFSCGFTAIDKQQAFRAPRITPKPIVQGPQTAIVVGKSGEEIWTDKYGRVKVQFHWDRYGKEDENSSCWVRVSQVWAGAGWGSMHLPHIGHEVIVSFIEGDPDQPIITGRVYNDTNKPADSLPGEQHKSVIRSFGDNDIVIEDKEGDKQIHIKQACGNEIRMNENTPDIEIKQECGNEVLMKASGPDIEIKQACGNEILMHEAEGIQIRDKYGNEVVLDAESGFIRIASPTHDSFIELGKSIVFNTDSNNESLIGADCKFTVMGATADVFQGIKGSFFHGLKTETFIGGKHSTSIGGVLTLNKAREYTKNWEDRDRKSDGHIKYDSKKFIHLIGGPGNESQLQLKKPGATLSSGGDGYGDGFVKISDDGVHIKANKGKIILEGPEIVLIADKTKIMSDLTHVTKGKLKHKDTDIT